MDFSDQLKQFSERVTQLESVLQTEEATKTALIMPFFQMLGYDVFNPQEFSPEFVADVGIKRGEKVDYAIINDGKPVILVECKAISEPLDRHSSQLFRYFGTTDAKFAILTNGRYYRFYTDLDSPNKMDSTPFLSIDVLDLQESQIPELKRFCKSQFDVDAILGTASELKYVYEFKRYFADQLSAPADDFVKLFLQASYNGQKNKNTIDRFRPIVQKALNSYINETMNSLIKSALGGVSDSAPQDTPADDAQPEKTVKTPNIVTTVEELEAYFIIKTMMADLVDIQDITYKDTESYINILYKGNSRKWICRLKLTDTNKVLILPTKSRDTEKYHLSSIYELSAYKEQLTSILARYI